MFGARYTHPLRPEFPHFEAKKNCLELVSLFIERMIRRDSQIYVSYHYGRGFKKMCTLFYARADRLSNYETKMVQGISFFNVGTDLGMKI